MFPMILDSVRKPVLVIGEGQAAMRRLAQLRQAGANPPVFAPNPEAELARAAGDNLHRHWPKQQDMVGAVVFIATPDVALAERLATSARKAGALVNVEDMKSLCDFHVPAMVRRGDLLFSISTGGRAPGLATALKEHLAGLFGEEWGERLNRLAKAREGWRAEGLSLPELAKRARAMIGAEKWLPL